MDVLFGMYFLLTVFLADVLFKGGTFRMYFFAADVLLEYTFPGTDVLFGCTFEGADLLFGCTFSGRMYFLNFFGAGVSTFCF